MCKSLENLEAELHSTDFEPITAKDESLSLQTKSKAESETEEAPLLNPSQNSLKINSVSAKPIPEIEGFVMNLEDKVLEAYEKL